MVVLKVAFAMFVTLLLGVVTGFAYGEFQPPRFSAVQGRALAVDPIPTPWPHRVTDDLLSVPMSVVLEQRAERRALAQPQSPAYADPGTAEIEASLQRELREAARIALETPMPLPSEQADPTPPPLPPLETPPPLGSTPTLLSSYGQSQTAPSAPPASAPASVDANPAAAAAQSAGATGDSGKEAP